MDLIVIFSNLSGRLSFQSWWYWGSPGAAMLGYMLLWNMFSGSSCHLRVVSLFSGSFYWEVFWDQHSICLSLLFILLKLLPILLYSIFHLILFYLPDYTLSNVSDIFSVMNSGNEFQIGHRFWSWSCRVLGLAIHVHLLRSAFSRCCPYFWCSFSWMWLAERRELMVFTISKRSDDVYC